jgi:succinate-semialdehyde dehydrogenase / glutarate-semialdehyde dehydrogenase
MQFKLRQEMFMNAESVFAQLNLYIDGQFRPGSERQTVPVHNPATGEVLGHLAQSTIADLDEALGAADRAFRTWSMRPAYERQMILEKAATLMEARRDEIARVLTMEMGKTLVEAKGEVDFAIATTRWYGEECRRAYGRLLPARAAGHQHMVLKEPVGPVLAFVSWNFPASNVIRKVAGAVAAGCSIIIRPSEETPGTALAIARCLHDAGLPAGVLNVVTGRPSETSTHLMASPVAKKVSVTGSVAVGKLIARLATETLKRCTMELGGHAPVIIAKDCDPEKAAAIMVAAKFRNAGQVCTSPTRFLVEEAVYDRFVTAFAEKSQTLVVGDGLDPVTTMGALVNSKRLDWTETLVQDARDRGAWIVTGGQRIGNKGWFYAPTVIANVNPDQLAMNEEPFAPIALMMPVASIDAALEEANRLPVGLASYGFTTSQATAHRIRNTVNAGLVGINQPVVSLAEAPFGGVNETGWGSEGGIEGLDTFLRTKFVNEMAV